MVLIIIAGAVGVIVGYQVVRVWLVLTLEKLIRGQWRTNIGYVEDFYFLTAFGRKVNRADKKSEPLSVICLRVKYEINKKLYVTKKVNLWDFLGADNYSSDVSDKLNRVIDEGGEVTVYFNPENPENAVVEPVAGRRILYDCFLHMGLAVVGLILLILYGGFLESQWITSAKTILYGAAGGAAVGVVLIVRVIRSIQ